MSQLKLGSVSHDDKLAAEALEPFRKAQRLLEDLIRELPDDLQSHSLVGRALDDIGITLLELGDPARRAEAEEAVLRRRCSSEIAVRGAPDIVDFNTARNIHKAIVSQSKGLEP